MKSKCKYIGAAQKDAQEFAETVQEPQDASELTSKEQQEEMNLTNRKRMPQKKKVEEAKEQQAEEYAQEQQVDGTGGCRCLGTTV